MRTRAIQLLLTPLLAMLACEAPIKPAPPQQAPLQLPTATCLRCCTKSDALSTFKSPLDPMCAGEVPYLDYTPDEWFADQPIDTDQADLWVGPPEGINWRPTIWEEDREFLFWDDGGYSGPGEVTFQVPPEGVSFEKDDDIVDEMPCTENYRFLDSLGEWYRDYAPPTGDPNDGICECSEFVAESNVFLADEPAQNRQTRPRTIGNEPAPPTLRTRSFRAVVRALPAAERAVLRTTQGRRLLNRLVSGHLKDQYFDNGRTQPRRKIVLIGRGPAGATVVAELNTELRNNPPPDFTVVAIGLVTHFEHMGNFESGQTNPRFAVPAHLQGNNDINPETYRGMFPAARRRYLAYGAIAAAVEAAFATLGPGGDNDGVYDQHIGQASAVRRRRDGIYVATYHYEDDSRTATQEGEIFVMSTGSGMPRRLDRNLVAVDQALVDAGVDAPTARRTAMRSVRTIEQLFSTANANYEMSFDEMGRRVAPTEGTRTPLEQQVRAYTGKKVLVTGGGASGLMALDMLHFVLPELAAEGGGTQAEHRPDQVIFAHTGPAISDAVGSPLRSLVRRNGQYRRVFDLMQGTDPTLPEETEARIEEVRVVHVPGQRRRMLRVRLSNGHTHDVDEIVTAFGQESNIDRVIGQNLLKELRPLVAGTGATREVVGFWDGRGLVITGIGAAKLAELLLTPANRAPPGRDYSGADYATARDAADQYQAAVRARVTALDNNPATRQHANPGSLAVHTPMVQRAIQTLRANGFNPGTP